MAAPFVQIQNQSCLKFEYFSHTEFVVSLINENGFVDILNSQNGNHGTWNEVHVPIFPGGYVITWRSRTSDVDIPGYISGMDNVQLVDGRCDEIGRIIHLLYKSRRA